MTIPTKLTLDSLSPTVLVFLGLHITLAGAILVVSIRILSIAVRSQMEKNIVFSSLSLLVGVIVAVLGGILFLFDGQNNIFSFVMAVGFIAAIFPASILSKR